MFTSLQAFSYLQEGDFVTGIDGKSTRGKKIIGDLLEGSSELITLTWKPVRYLSM